MCMKGLAMATKGCGQLTSNNTYFADSWFGSVKNDEEAMAAGVDYCGLVKTIHKGFCIATLEKLMKDLTGGSYLVMKSTPRVTGSRPILAFLGFISSEGSRSTESGDPCLYQLPHIYSNVSVHPIVCPHFLGRH